MIDIGVNLTNDRFAKDRQQVLERARDAGIDGVIITGTNLGSSRQAVAIAQEFNNSQLPALYSTAGVHPHDADSYTDTTTTELKQLIQQHSGTIVAVGETGLDFNRNFSPREAQIKAFEQQIELAIATDLPLFLHERDALTTQRDILASYGQNLPPAVLHCFTGERHALETYLELGLWIGITGWVCDERRGGELYELIPEIPLERLMIETDAPYLIPRTLKPKPKSNRNEPAYLPAVTQTLAGRYEMSEEALAQATAANSRRFFGL